MFDGIWLVMAGELTRLHVEKQIKDRDANRDIGEELLDAIREVKAGSIGARYDSPEQEGGRK
jgi:hypothetical protein